MREGLESLRYYSKSSSAMAAAHAPALPANGFIDVGINGSTAWRD